jgi:hypothetical protein
MAARQVGRAELDGVDVITGNRARERHGKGRRGGYMVGTAIKFLHQRRAYRQSRVHRLSCWPT